MLNLLSVNNPPIITKLEAIKAPSKSKFNIHVIEI